MLLVLFTGCIQTVSKPSNLVYISPGSHDVMLLVLFTGCIHMVSQPSHLVYISPGSHDVCALYMIGLPDQVVEIEFTDFTIGCEDGGLLAVRTSW